MSERYKPGGQRPAQFKPSELRTVARALAAEHARLRRQANHPTEKQLATPGFISTRMVEAAEVAQAFEKVEDWLAFLKHQEDTELRRQSEALNDATRGILGKGRKS